MLYIAQTALVIIQSNSFILYIKKLRPLMIMQGFTALW